MPYTRRRLNFIKLCVIFAASIVAVIGFSGLSPAVREVGASAFGPTPAHTGAPGEANCTACHTSYPLNSGSGSVTITGLPVSYSPGQQIPITVTTSQSDAVIYGFQMTAIDSFGRSVGTYTLPGGSPQRTQVLTGIVGGNERNYVEHTIDGVTPTQFGTNSWTFTWTAPAGNRGPVGFYAAGNAANSDGGPGQDYIYTTSKLLPPRSAVSKFDFEGDGKTDVSIFRPSDGTWWYQRSSDGQVPAAQFGTGTDKVVAADYTGDGKTDIAFFRPSTGQWFVLRSEDGSFYAFPFGTGTDIPAPADYDGDGKADPAVFRPSAATWFILRSSDSQVAFVGFGAAGDLPVASDYDGDGKADIAIYRPNGTNGAEWWWIKSSTGTVAALQFGISTDKAVPGDFTGDGRADVAFFRPSDGQWFVLRSEDFSYYAFPFGAAGDVPVPGDYDGDGKWDAAVFRASGSTWFINRSTAGVQITSFGLPTDQPLPNAYVR